MLTLVAQVLLVIGSWAQHEAAVGERGLEGYQADGGKSVVVHDLLIDSAIDQGHARINRLFHSAPRS